MDLPRDGEEYARITFSELPEGVTVEASVDGRQTWHPTTPGDSPSEVRFLIRGPLSTSTLGVPVTPGGQLWVRIVDVPETVVRSAGPITVY